MEDDRIGLELKARLILSGVLHVPREIRIPFPTSKSSAGPGAGRESIVIKFLDKRVKLPISRDDGKLHLAVSLDGHYEILDELERLVVSGVDIQPTLCHAPDQAFVSLGRSCQIGCAFCAINEAGDSGKEEITVDRAFEMISAAADRSDLTGVALTSGIETTVDEQIDRMTELVQRVRQDFPELPIGIEPLITDREQLLRLRSAGADEIKVNIEAATEELFERLCPRRDYALTMRAIGWAAEVFGRGRVTSNIIIGLGETDDDIREAVRALAQLGSVANLRLIRVNEFNGDRLRDALGREPERMSRARLISIARMHRDILRAAGLSPREFRTMCFPCGCCDLVPEIDL